MTIRRRIMMGAGAAPYVNGTTLVIPAADTRHMTGSTLVLDTGEPVTVDGHTLTW